MTPLELKAIEQMYKLLSQHIHDLHKITDICRYNLKDAYEKPQEKSHRTVDTETFNMFQSLITKVDEIREWTSTLKGEK